MTNDATRYGKLAHEHADMAASLLVGVDRRTDEGPVHGIVKTQSATAHATLALFYQRAAETAGAE